MLMCFYGIIWQHLAKKCSSITTFFVILSASERERAARTSRSEKQMFILILMLNQSREENWKIIVKISGNYFLIILNSFQ
jgi:hypothetical protein